MRAKTPPTGSSSAEDAQARRVAPRLSRTDIELPAVPGTFHHLTGARADVFAGHLRLDQRGLDAVRQAAATMRTAVVESEEIAAKIEHHDVAAGNFDELALAGRDLIDGGDDVASH